MPKESDPQVLQQPALVLNRSWVPISTTTVRRALFLLVSGGARAVAPSTYELHTLQGWIAHGVCGGAVVRTPHLIIPAPEIIVLGRFDRAPCRLVPFSRSNLYRRDQQRCQYCARAVSGAEFSIDHVVPRSRGGQTNWENCVLSCVRCNLKKGNRPLRHTDMRLRRRPTRPEWSPCLGVREMDRRPSWRPFIGDRLWNIGLSPGERAVATA